jgi:hypothetical protein
MTKTESLQTQIANEQATAPAESDISEPIKTIEEYMQDPDIKEWEEFPCLQELYAIRRRMYYERLHQTPEEQQAKEEQFLAWKIAHNLA